MSSNQRPKATRTKAARTCIDCAREGITSQRKIALNRNGTPVPGARCRAHHKARMLHTRGVAWEKRLMMLYGITVEEYWAIYYHQDGKCYICQRATGARKKLSVDHDHKTGFVRGLLCAPCNRDVLGHLRDDAAALQRAVRYLKEPPAFDIIGQRAVPEREI